MARAHCAYCTSPVEPVWATRGGADALVTGISVEWCARCRGRVPALLGALEPAREVAAPLPGRAARWLVN
jgi:hypothetical protein